MPRSLPLVTFLDFNMTFNLSDPKTLDGTLYMHFRKNVGMWEAEELFDMQIVGSYTIKFPKIT